MTAPALSAIVYQARGELAAPSAGPAISITAPPVDSEARGRVEVSDDVISDGFTQVTFAAKVGGCAWRCSAPTPRPARALREARERPSAYAHLNEQAAPVSCRA